MGRRAPARLPGPYPVGRYAVRLREQLRSFAHVQLTGEIANLRAADAPAPTSSCATPRARSPARCGATTGTGSASSRDSLATACRGVVAGGCDYYPGSASASPSFSFSVTICASPAKATCWPRSSSAGGRWRADGLLERQRQLPRPVLPRTIGVVCGEGGKAGEDLVAALERRGWHGRIVWAYAPVQDRHAAGGSPRRWATSPAPAPST
jgi:exodeoxyribonuclease VII large subunit